MSEVNKIVLSEHGPEHPLAIVGGDHAFLDVWPVNPEGENLLLVMTLFCERLSGLTQVSNVEKYSVVHVFSTYSTSGYFLENIAYDPNDAEPKDFTSNYTTVLAGDFSKSVKSGQPCMPKRVVSVQPEPIAEHVYPAFSFFSKHMPEALAACADVKNEYEFVCQLYSSDFPAPFKDVFYLTDATGYVLIRKAALTHDKKVGAFFVLAS